MTYTETKERDKKRYYYRVKSVRKGKKVDKERVYLGANLSKQELSQKEQEADKQLLGIKEEIKQKPQKNKEQKNKKSIGINVSKQEDMPNWYSQVCLKAGLADYGPVKGTMIIKPLGYSIWEKIQDYFNNFLQSKEIPNAYFPLFIPESFFKKEAEHAEGFTPEVAWIEKKEETDERLAIRPTSETIIYDAYSKWIRSWRDLPFRLNQWANIVRWEVSDTKLFLRSREFLWQEGHCVYETEKECEKEVLMILDEYANMCKNLLALPVLKGKKTKKEKFAGAKDTYGIEAFMPDGKALQAGTSHNLGQGFAKAFGINYIDQNEKTQTPWQNSWGVSTRLIGATIMTHSDDKGLVLPPSLAPIQIVIIPIFKGKNKNKIMKEVEKIKSELEGYKVKVDAREEYSPGYKFNEYELTGIPLRIEIGERDIQNNSVVLARRDTGEKQNVKIKELTKTIKSELDNMRTSLYQKAEKFLKSSIKEASTFEEMQKIISNKQLALVPFCGEIECEDNIKDKTGGAGSRVIAKEIKSGKCVQCGKPAKVMAYISKSY